MKQTNLVLSLSSMLLLLVLSGCTSTTQVNTRYYTTAEPTDSPLLIVANMPDADTARQWEEHCQRQFVNDTLRVEISQAVFPQWFAQGQSAILDYAQTNEIDRVLVVNLTSLLLLPQQEMLHSGQNPLDQQQQRDHISVWRSGEGSQRDVERAVDPVKRHRVELRNASGTLLWHAETQTREANSLRAIATSQCKALASELRDVNLIK